MLNNSFIIANTAPFNGSFVVNGSTYVYTFNRTGVLKILKDVSASVTLVGGGGAGDYGDEESGAGGGGGEVIWEVSTHISKGLHNVVVGKGGRITYTQYQKLNVFTTPTSSVFNGITARNASNAISRNMFGTGGEGGASGTLNKGGLTDDIGGSGGGGGAYSVGIDASWYTGGDGGHGQHGYGGGGGGGSYTYDFDHYVKGGDGFDGGGNGGSGWSDTINGIDASPNTGGGGGGGGAFGTFIYGTFPGQGADGVIIIKFIP